MLIRIADLSGVDTHALGIPGPLKRDGPKPRWVGQEVDG